MNNPVLGTREQIVESVVADLTAITKDNGYLVDVDEVKGFADTFDELNGLQLHVEPVGVCRERSLLSDLHRKEWNLSITGRAWNPDWAGDADALRQTTETLLRETCKALRANPRRLLSGVARAHMSTVIESEPSYEDGVGRINLVLNVISFDVQ